MATPPPNTTTTAMATPQKPREKTLTALDLFKIETSGRASDAYIEKYTRKRKLSPKREMKKGSKKETKRMVRTNRAKKKPE